MMKYTGESQLPRLSDEEFTAIRATTRPYTVCILRAGPKFEMPGPDPTVGVTAIIYAHGKRNVAMHVAGLLPVVCPVGDGSGITGVSIFDLSLDDTRRVMDADPGVQARVFTYELHPCRSIPGSTLPSSRDVPEEQAVRI
jgi:hypothetical protein